MCCVHSRCCKTNNSNQASSFPAFWAWHSGPQFTALWQAVTLPTAGCRHRLLTRILINVTGLWLHFLSTLHAAKSTVRGHQPVRDSCIWANDLNSRDQAATESRHDEDDVGPLNWCSGGHWPSCSRWTETIFIFMYKELWMFLDLLNSKECFFPNGFDFKSSLLNPQGKITVTYSS